MTAFELALIPLLLFAIAGAGRVSLYFVNHLVFGRKNEWSLVKWLVVLLAILFVLLPVAAVIVLRSLDEQAWSLMSIVSAAFVAALAISGVWWIVHRIAVNRFRDRQPGGTRSSSVIHEMRTAHIRNDWLRRLGLHNDVYDLEMSRHDIAIRDLDPRLEQLTVGFLSDTHVAPFLRKDFFVRAAEELMARAPEVILLGGDYVTWRRHIPLLSSRLLDHLSAPLGIYAVLGNHDYWSGADEITRLLESHGVAVARNGRRTLERNGASIDLVMVDELYRGEPQLGLLDVPRKHLTILLTHHPDLIANVGDRRIDLMLAGHTHGGQIRLPLMGSIVVPSKFETKFDEGFFRVANTLLYVGRGLGSVPPVRILCKPEVAIFRFTREL
jgi:uncharacterized protein